MTNVEPSQLPQTVNLTSKKCPSCDETESFDVPVGDAQRYLEGVAHIQDALPTLSAAQRERLISGYCGPCWSALWTDVDSELEGDDGEVG